MIYVILRNLRKMEVTSDTAAVIYCGLFMIATEYADTPSEKN